MIFLSTLYTFSNSIIQETITIKENISLEKIYQEILRTIWQIELLRQEYSSNIATNKCHIKSQKRYLKAFPCFCWINQIFFTQSTLVYRLLNSYFIGLNHTVLAQFLMPSEYIQSFDFFFSSFTPPPPLSSKVDIQLTKWLKNSWSAGLI